MRRWFETLIRLLVRLFTEGTVAPKEEAAVRLWLEVFDTTYTTKLGDGPIFVRSANVRRGLDETGSASADVNGVDPRALALLTPRRVCEIWVHEDGFDKRKVGSFVVEGDNHSLTSGSNTRGVNGRTAMVELVNTIVLPGLSYTNQTVETVVDALCALAGWTADVDASIASNTVSVQFGGGESILKALQVVCEIEGVHLREDASTSKQVEISPFGADAGVWIDYIEGDGGEIHRRSDSPMLIEQIQVIEESADIFNYCLGFAGGSGDAAIDLGLSTRAFVESVSANGRTHYIIKDDTSIATYGQIARRVDAKRIVPVANTDSALQYAADAAADAIKAKLDRHKDPQQIMTVMLRNVRTTIQVGDKVHLTYQGMTNKNNLPYKYLDIDADFWVMRATEVVRAEGIVLQLTITNIDRYQTDAANVIVGMVDAIQAQEVDVQPYPAILSWGPFQKPIDTVTDIEFKFPIFDNVLRLNSVQVYIIRDVWTAVAAAAAGGGGLRIKVGDNNGLTGAPPPTSYWVEFFTKDSEGGANNVNFWLPISSGNKGADMWSFAQQTEHTHSLVFDAVQQDSVKPEDVDVFVNGVQVANDLFPDDASSLYVDADIAVIDITGQVKQETEYRKWHEMTISCGTNRGDIAVVFVIDADISKVRVV